MANLILKYRESLYGIHKIPAIISGDYTAVKLKQRIRNKEKIS